MFNATKIMRSIIVDVETTGLSVLRGGRVIEVGAVALGNGMVVAELDTLIKTGTSISYGAYRVHGISEEMLYGKPSPDNVWSIFRAGTTPRCGVKRFLLIDDF